MRTAIGVVEKGADALGHLRTEDVLEGAGVRFHFLLIAHLEGIGKQALREPVAPDDAGGAGAAVLRHGQDGLIGAQQPHLFHQRQDLPAGGPVPSVGRLDALRHRLPTIFLQHPDLR